MANFMIVDDSLVMRKSIKRSLLSEGHSVIYEASTGTDAVRSYSTYKPDIITMDIDMPMMDGVTATKTILKDNPDAIIVMISSHSEREMVIEALKHGAKNYLVKPVECDKLAIAVNSLISKYLTGKDKNANNTNNTLISADSDKESGKNALFQIENQAAGSFVVHIKDGMQIKDYELLNNSLQGLIFIKPLSLLFDFSEIITPDPVVIMRISQAAKAIKDSGEMVKIRCTDAMVEIKAMFELNDIEIIIK